MHIGIKPHLKIFATLLFSSCFIVSAYGGENSLQTVRILSKPHTIDRVYKSMEGITDKKRFNLLTDLERSELLWVTSGKIDIFAEDDGSNKTERFLCHAYMKFDYQFFKEHGRRELVSKTLQYERIFTFVQGQSEIRLPYGYGIPVSSKELFEFNFMVINPSPLDSPVEVKAQGTFEYYVDNELATPIKPLFMRIVGMKVPVRKDDKKKSAHCSELGDILDAVPAKLSLHKIHKNLVNDYEQVYHWMVPPGRHVYRYLLESNIMVNSMSFNTTVHYINAHLHPHGESIEVRNLTTGESLFKTEATNNPERTALINLTNFTSEDGIMIDRAHQYEMIAVYDNKTDQDIDAMAILFFYLLDKSYDQTDLSSSKRY